MKNKTLTLGSLFDGSGGFPLGGLLAGVTPVWASEVEPFPIRVTSKRLPFMKHYGDITAMDGGNVEPVDIITFGSPCQDMSVAGRRDGLDGSRSSLFYEAVRIIKEMRCATGGKYPRYIVWENVPGAFSSNKGEDFKAVLEAVIGIVQPDTQVPMPEKARWSYADLYMGDGWSVAYRTLDAQYWGVPQRRRRIYLVADLAGRGAGKILFESEGLSGYSAEGFRSWQRAAGSFETRIGAAGYDGYNGSLTEEVSSTLGVNCGMSTGRNGIVLNDQGGNRMDITEEVTSTLRAEAHHPPCVMESAGFCTEHSAKSRTIGYEEECSPTLRAGVVPAAVALENHPIDSRVKLSEDGNVQTLTSRMGTGGNNVPLVMKIRSGCEGGGKGPLIQENKSATLSCNNDQTLFEPRAYGICSKDSNAMKSDNPHSGIYEAETARTLDGNGGNPSCNQGGIAVVAFTQNQRDEVRDLGDRSAVVCANAGTKQQTFVLQGSMIGREDKNGPQGDGINEDVSFTLNTVDRHAVYSMTTGSFTQVAEEKAPTVLARDYKDPTAVCYGIGRDTFNQGQNAKFAPTFEEELQPTLVAKGPGAIQSGYTVRRLTPTECARLQGFPDNWCADLGTEKPTDEEMYFWHKVFKTYSEVTGCKVKSDKQVAKWLKNPYSDSAEYKMWGNGVALPCVWFVLCGIVWYAQSGGDNAPI
jgi:DNA (cytosine-5)-methyltransferase 1